MKRIVRLLTLCLLLTAALSVTAVASPTPPPIPTEGDVWDGVTITQPTKIVQKDGVNYYEISTCAEFAYIAITTTGNWCRANYLLTNDLILNDVILTWDDSGNLQNDPETLHCWTPFCCDYSGIFDGCGHTVSGAYVNKGDDYASLFSYVSGTVKSLNVVNSSFSGARFCGGIVGDAPGSSSFSDLVFSGTVKGTEYIGGVIAQCRSGGSVTNCVNYGRVYASKGYIGGISSYSYSDFVCCANFGAVTSKVGVVGGIVGNGRFGSCTGCSNHGAICGTGHIGGIIGWASNQPIECCYNAAQISGTSNFVGGIVGNMDNSAPITDCYNVGEIISTDDDYDTGAIVGTDGAVWGKDTIIRCYYLKTDGLYGCGGVTSANMEPNGFFAKTIAELKQQSTYAGWDFTDTWRVAPDHNGGYPYLAWQDVSNIPITGLTLNQAALSLGVGDAAYLTVSQQPATAELPALTWTSSDNTVATVNGNGRVTAAGAGTATITVSGGGFSATCAVTVSPRAADEYRIGALSVRDADGALLSTIPQGSFLVTVPITKTAAGGDSLIALAAYSASGQFRGLLYVEAEALPVGVTIRVTLPVDNTKGDIARLKAFPIASFASPTPLGAASAFPAQ